MRHQLAQNPNISLCFRPPRAYSRLPVAQMFVETHSATPKGDFARMTTVSQKKGGFRSKKKCARSLLERKGGLSSLLGQIPQDLLYHRGPLRVFRPRDHQLPLRQQTIVGLREAHKVILWLVRIFLPTTDGSVSKGGPELTRTDTDADTQPRRHRNTHTHTQKEYTHTHTQQIHTHNKYTHTQIHTHTDTQTHRHTHTQHTHTNTHTQIHTHTTNTHTHKYTHTQTHRHTDTQTHRHTDTQTHRHTDTQTHRHTDTQTHRHTDTQTHRHTDTQTHRHTETHTHTSSKHKAQQN